MSTPTKYAFIVLGGAADEPLGELGDKSPIEAAETPYLDSIVEIGRMGTVRTIPSGLPFGSDVGLMTLLGYDAQKYYSGRAPIEAVSQNLRLRPDDVVFRCNLVNLDEGSMNDYTAGRIRTAEAASIMRDLTRHFVDEKVLFYPGVSYRNLAVIDDPSTLDVSCMPPHEIAGEAVEEYLPKGKAAKRIRELMSRAAAILAEHDVNHVRADLGEPVANAIWLWGQGRVPIMPRFRHRFGVRGAAVAAVDLVRGLAKLLGWTVVDAPGATGGRDTDYSAKARAAIGALETHDLVAIHVEAADESGHMGLVDEKVAALERIDEHIIAPVLEHLRRGLSWRLLVASDHSTLVSKRTHADSSQPFCMAGSDVSRVVPFDRFNERLAAQSDLHIEAGHDLMEYFLKG
jgi:2,3-bisphosphoglycerate-independent phosphoglycerate mutase